MIKINLLGEQSAGKQAGTYQLVIFGASLVLVLLATVIIRSSLSGQVVELQSEIDELDAQLKNLQRITAKVRDLEKQKDELRRKLVVIAKLKRSKAGPVRVLDDLNTSIPEKSWVLSAEESAGSFMINGLALDNQTIAVFMKDLESSDFFDKVDLVETRQTDWQEVKMKNFVLSTSINYVGKLQSAEDGEDGMQGGQASLTGAAVNSPAANEEQN